MQSENEGEFKKQISDTLSANDLGVYSELVEEYVHENEISLERVAAALAKLAQGVPFQSLIEDKEEEFQVEEEFGRKEKRSPRGNSRGGDRKRSYKKSSSPRKRDERTRDSEDSKPRAKPSKPSRDKPSRDKPKRGKASNTGSFAGKRKTSSKKRKPASGAKRTQKRTVKN